MKFYHPHFTVATLEAVPQTALRSKLGGEPWGFPLSRWPYCRECSRPMALLAQLLHEPPMLYLGDEADVLHLFQCPTAGCSSYECDAGCTAGLILRKDELTNSLTATPRDTHPTGQIYAYVTGGPPPEETWQVPLNGELWLTRWEAHEDNIPADRLGDFFDDTAFWKLPETLKDPFSFDSIWQTKTGSAPYWSANGVAGTVARIPRPPYAFLLQISDSIRIAGPVPEPDRVGCDVTRCGDGGKLQNTKVSRAARRGNAPFHILYVHDDGNDTGYWAHVANFGSGFGSAYVFIDRSHTPPDIIWFWSG